MAKEKAAAVDASKKSAKKTKKSGKGKLFLFLILLIVILAGAGYYVGLDKTVIAFIDEQDLIETAKENLEVVWERKSDIPEPPKPVLEIKKEPPQSENKKQVAKRTVSKNYYVKVEDCVNMTCEQEVSQLLKQEKVPYTNRQRKRRSIYYELISDTVFTRQVAEAKIGQLKNESEIIGEPYLVADHNRYRISLGRFPREDTGIRIKSELADLYPKYEINFEVRAKNTVFTVKSIYAGPFKKSTAEAVLKKLKEYPGYESSEITRKL